MSKLAARPGDRPGSLHNYGASLTLILVMCLALPLSAICSEQTGRTTALRITSDNAEQLVQAGPDATGGIGDWFISNGTICAIISGVDHEGEFSTRGGVLIDLGFCDRADDHYTMAQDLIDGERSRPMDAQDITASSNDSGSTITVRSTTLGVEQTATYTLSTDAPTQLAISKRIKRTNQTDGFGIYSALNFNYHSLEPFVFNSADLSQSNGFTQEDFVSRGTSAITVATRNADTIITVSPPTAVAPISYGWQLTSARRISAQGEYDLPRFMLVDDESNAMMILADTFYIGDGSSIGLIQLPQIPFLSLPEDDFIELQEKIYVGKGGDVASITDQILPDTTQVSGTLKEPRSALHVELTDGTPVTFVRADGKGKFSFKIPRGEYRIRHLGSADRSTTRSLTVGSDHVQLGELALPPASSLMLPRGQAMRLVFVGLDGTQNPNFADTLTEFSVMEADGQHFRQRISQVFLAGINSDPSLIELAPGRYRVYATRGPEYSLEQTDISVAAGRSARLTIQTPKQVLETPGFIAGDLHVHSGGGYDNTFSDTERVRTFVAEHGEVMVSSEHDMPVDFAPIIRSMGVSDKITSIPAAEVTSLLPGKRNRFTGGHMNFFPYQPDPLAHRRGMVKHEELRLREIMHAVSKAQPDAIAQLNHPRTNLALSGELPNDYESLIDYGHYLDHMGVAAHPYNPTQPLNSVPNNSLIEKDPDTGLRDLDFDLIEVINPGGVDHEHRLQAVRRDWLSFLKQGEKIVGTANSDSHTNETQVAVPRTMVAVTGDTIATFKQSQFIEGLKSGNAYGTTGPMIELSLSGKLMGETFQGDRGQMKLRITTADWIPVTEARIQINGETVDEYQLKPGNTHNLLIPLAFTTDSFVTVEVSGPATADYSYIYPEITPYAFSNPIYVDFDSDGKWQPPGL